jgi:phospholipase/carboxylesterase
MTAASLAGIESLVVGAPEPHQTVVILLHGYAMSAADLAPFGHSLGVPALFLFPQGPVTPESSGRAWWLSDFDGPEAARRSGRRDLADRLPEGLAAARDGFDRYVQACRREFQPQQLIVGGFSQGGMLACDWLLHCAPALDGLLLLSASRINFLAWPARAAALRDLPVLISHGREDPNLAFAAGEGLRDFALDAGARVTWVPFDGGHEIPLPVWRAVRRFLVRGCGVTGS